jgi:2-methylcitrate dehydratase
MIPNALRTTLQTSAAVSQRSRFSTMAALQSAAPPPVLERAYDPEIKDMAHYIHDYKIESDLAVCGYSRISQF